jgi:hypothetical protein
MMCDNKITGIIVLHTATNPTSGNTAGNDFPKSFFTTVQFPSKRIIYFMRCCHRIFSNLKRNPNVNWRAIPS